MKMTPREESPESIAQFVAGPVGEVFASNSFNQFCSYLKLMNMI